MHKSVHQVSFQEFSDHVNVVRRARNARKAKSRWLSLAKSVGQAYDEALEDLDERELQRRVEESERVERAMQRNFALREQADRDDGNARICVCAHKIMYGRRRCGLVKLAGVLFFVLVLLLFSTARAHFTFFPILLWFVQAPT